MPLPAPLLCGSGPSPVPDRVREALARPTPGPLDVSTAVRELHAGWA